jgi:flagellar protein FlaD
VLMKWLQYLIDKCGRVYLSEVLEYYVDIGWISEEAKIGLLDYSGGITEESKKNDATRKPMSHLPSKDHIQSLLFIQKLKGNQVDKHFLDRIDGELSKITKKLHADH